MENLFKFLKPNESITIEYLSHLGSYRITLISNTHNCRKTRFCSSYIISQEDLFQSLNSCNFIVTCILDNLRKQNSKGG